MARMTQALTDLGFNSAINDAPQEPLRAKFRGFLDFLSVELTKIKDTPSVSANK